MRVRALKELGLKTSVLDAISRAVSGAALNSHESPGMKSLGQYFGGHPQEGIYGTSSGVIALYNDDPSNNSALISYLRDWLIDQKNRDTSISNIQFKFYNNFKYCLFLMALNPAMNIDNYDNRYDDYFKEYIDRMNPDTLGWNTRKILPEEKDNIESSYDKDTTALSILALRGCPLFMDSPKSNQCIVNFLNKIDQSLSQRLAPAQLKYLLSISIILLKDLDYTHLPENKDAILRKFRKCLLNLYFRRGRLGIKLAKHVKKADLLHYDIQITAPEPVKEDKYSIEPKYLKLLVDVLALAALLPPENKKIALADIFQYVRSIRVIQNLSSALYSDFKQGRLFLPNEVGEGKYSTVDHGIIAFVTRRYIYQLPILAKIERLRFSWYKVIPSMCLMSIILAAFGALSWSWLWVNVIWPAISVAYPIAVSKWLHLTTEEGNN